MLNEKDKLKELFSEKLGNFEAPVNPELWSAVASKIGTSTLAASTGVSALTKAIIGIAAGVVGVATYFVLSSKEKETIKIETPSISKTEASLKIDKVEERTILPTIQKEKSVAHTSSTSTIEKENVLKTSSKVEQKDASKELMEFTPIPKKSVSETILPAKSEGKKELIQQPEIVLKKEINKEESIAILKEESTSLKLAEINQLSNVFSPDGDGINDELFITFEGELVDFNVVVMNDKNQAIYQSRDAYFRWNGIMMNGSPAPVGNYYYVITARDMNDNPINKYSRLAIFR